MAAATTARTDPLREYIFRKRQQRLQQRNTSYDQAYKNRHSKTKMELKEQKKSMENNNFDRFVYLCTIYIMIMILYCDDEWCKLDYHRMIA